MKQIRIINGAYGYRPAGAAHSRLVLSGQIIKVDDAEAARLAALGVAVYTEDSPDPVEPEPASEPAAGGSGAQSDVQAEQLERMTRADLELMAQDLGVDISGARNKREIAALIAAAEAREDGEEISPDLDDGDIVR